MEVIPGSKRPRISHEGYFYVTDYFRNDTSYMKCSVKQRLGCKGRGILTAEAFKKTAEHNHAPNQSAIKRAKARIVMKQRGQATVEPAHAVRAAAEADMSLAAKEDMPRDSDINRSIRRYRQQGGQVPAEPASLADLIIPPEMSQTKGAPGLPEERFLLYDSLNDEAYGGGRIVIFTSDWGLEKLALSLHWAADGTFKVSPTLFQQLYTIHATTLGVTVPCVYALLQDKTERTYHQMLTQVRAAILQHHPDAPGIYGTVITDLERAAMNGFQEVFPEKQRSSCFFHLSQAVWRKLQSLGLQRQYAEDTDFALQVRAVLLDLTSKTGPHIHITHALLGLVRPLPSAGRGGGV